jgi:hypothetical protein
MHHRHAALAGQNIHRFGQLVIVGIPPQLQVGQEEFERAYTHFHHAGDFRNLFYGIEEPAVQAEVQPGSFQAILEHFANFLLQAFSLPGVGKMQQGRGASISGDQRAAFDIIQVNRVDVHVDDPWKNEFSSGIHHLLAAFSLQSLSDSGYLAIFNCDIAGLNPLTGNDDSTCHHEIVIFGHPGYPL